MTETEWTPAWGWAKAALQMPIRMTAAAIGPRAPTMVAWFIVQSVSAALLVITYFLWAEG